MKDLFTCALLVTENFIYPTISKHKIAYESSMQYLNELKFASSIQYVSNVLRS